MPVHFDNTWQTQEAKARFSELLRAAQVNPQWITYRGEKAGVLLSSEEYKKLKKKYQKSSGKKTYRTLGEFLDDSPLKGINLDPYIIRRPEPPRNVDL